MSRWRNAPRALFCALLLSLSCTRASPVCAACAPNAYCAGARDQATACPDYSSSPAGSTALVDCRCNAGFTGPDGGDPSSVLFDTVKKAVTDNVDIVLCDTAGRLHTKANLMEELKKVHRSLAKACPGAPHEVILVLDATVGQNAIAQAKQFGEAAPLTGIILTKLDGTAKGGVVLGIVDELKVPVRYIGVGEAIGDLRTFVPKDFVEALFSDTVGAPPVS